MRLEGKRTLVTGAGRGIGAAVARRFSKEGARVAVLDIKGDTADKTVSEIAGAISLHTDICDEAAVQAAFARVQKEFGGLDILVHCAAILETKDILDVSTESWRETVDTNLTGTFFCMREAAKLMLGSKAEKPNMVIFASSSGLKANQNYSAYGASKAGVAQLVRCGAVDLSSKGIRVNAIAPGPIQTPMRPDPTPESTKMIQKVVPLGRLGQPDEVANAVLFLASDEASYITGEIFFVDGGITPAGAMNR
jgi:3-oxoacyl-[acyl-carrier protein] reductase